MTALTLDAPASVPAQPVPKLALAAALALVGDRLFYDHPLGISLALFLALIGMGAFAVHRGRTRGRQAALALALLAAGVAPLVESVGVLSLAWGIAGLALACATLAGTAGGLRARLAAAWEGFRTGPVGLCVAIVETAGRMVRRSPLPRGGALLGWVLPLVLGGVFAGLIALANPLVRLALEDLADLTASVPAPGLDPLRLLVCLGLLVAVWGFLSPRLRPRTEPTVPQAVKADETPGAIERLLDPGTILRCLVLFNLLFAVQSGTDILYLWGGLDLPPGLTYAAYAHRGAYPLVVTALLAGAFVLAALRPGGAGEAVPAIRVLVFLWIGQTILLVASAMLRLDLYVAAYALTRLRLAAFVWMGLVAVGLALVLARIALRRSNGWLVDANGLALGLTLYGLAFVNVPGVIADYNADHGRAPGDFDFHYALGLGAEAIPAVDRMLADTTGAQRHSLLLWRTHLIDEVAARMEDWRGWTYRDRRLLDYIAAHPLPAAAPMPEHGEP